jgi:hypothetical protein
MRMIDNQKQIDIIDSRNRYAKDIQTRADTDTFSYDAYVKETILMAEEQNYENGFYCAKIRLVLRNMDLGEFELAYKQLEAIRKSIDVSKLSLYNQMDIYVSVNPNTHSQ